MIFKLSNGKLMGMCENMTKNQIYKKCFIVFICLLVFGNLAHSSALCFGSDGHISIEFNPAGYCDEYLSIAVAASSNSGTNANYTEGANSCGNCVDIPLTGNHATKRPASFSAKKFLPVAALSKTIISVPTNDSVSTNKERIATLANPISDILASIGTTVLVI